MCLVLQKLLYCFVEWVPLLMLNLFMFSLFEFKPPVLVLVIGLSQLGVRGVYLFKACLVSLEGGW